MRKIITIASFLAFVAAAWVSAASPLPDGFRSISLGMSLDAVKGALAKDSYYNFRGDPDVSMLQRPQEDLIECEGFTYISRAYFQFHNKLLYTMILALDPALVSYYTVYTQLTAKYGDPTSLSPSAAIWQTPSVQLSLERPLSVKYIDRAVFDQLKAAGAAQTSQREVSRNEFLGQF